MSLADPLSVTISAVTSSLPRTSVGENKSEYKTADGLIVVSASHQYGKRTRRMFRIETSKIAPDPFLEEENVEVTMSNYIVFDTPPAGYTGAEQLAVYTGFKNLFSASSDAIIVKLLGGES
jgi:hypothetical protein